MKKNRITTKVGDKGFTNIYYGEKISKDSVLVDALGDIDELVSFLGLARLYAKKKKIKSEILDIQKDLFIAGAELATSKNSPKIPRLIDNKMVNQIEKKLNFLNESTNIPKEFTVPGTSLPSSYLDCSRAIARRCERKIVKLVNSKELKNKNMIIWFNRLSDYLYIMSRFEDGKSTIVKIKRRLK